ncbi:MAG: hypothetical protein H6828_05295 [Planctomycetes bacterium]|nr:hypothetical protein [Planctomycetota bacterium]
MKTSRALGLLSLALLSCATAPAAAAPGPAAQSGAPDDFATPPPAERDADAEFRPIRFGDAPELAYDAPFFPGAHYDPAVPTPDALLGQTHGSRLSHPAEIVRAYEAFAAASERMTLTTFGRTHEGRPLVYAVVTSPANHARLAELRAGHAKLADPRGISDAELDELARTLPPVAWMAYSIHGDELSGSDAAFALGYHLAACTDPEVVQLLEDLVIVLDPCQNPDGRERIIGMVEQSAGYTPNLDYASMHRGRWPFGRGNHYLFDMNRDWMSGAQPETRARWEAVRSWHPQLFVDAHEMSGMDTFLFYPQSAPLNPAFADEHLRWQGVFADEAGGAFDREGWGYYTREWADGWAPFYSDAWGSLNGAIGILYEQARTDGFQLKRASGEILTYREAVHHQITASMANLRSLQRHGRDVLASYLANKKKNVAADTPGNDRVLVIRADQNQDRLRRLQRTLDGHGIEYFAARGTVELGGAESARGERVESLELPAGSWVVPARQPQRQLVRAFLDLDQRIDVETLKKEREELERRDSTKMYDVTGWSLLHAYDLDAWWGVPGELEVGPAPRLAPQGGVLGLAPEGYPTYGWIVDGRDDSAVAFAARAMELGLEVHLSDRAFEDAGAEGGPRTWSRGSLLVRRHENQGSAAEIEARIERAARESGALATRVLSGRAPGEGPDLGGGHFHLLAHPRVALVANTPVDSDTYGHLWHHLDVEVGVPFSILDAQALGRADLRRYNVLVLPPGLGREVGEWKDDLDAWVAAGGTLIAVESTAAALTSGRSGLTSVTLRRDALEKLDDYATAVERERAARAIAIDEALVWDGATAAAQDAPGEEASADDHEDDEAADADLDAWRRRFAPSGANLLADVDDESWLTVGAGATMPVALSGSSVYLTKPPVDTPVRFVEAARLRLAGLLWPEARVRIADSAYLAREGHGAGQVILFAGMPAFRGYHQATARLFSNAVVYGPGMGASQPVRW